MEKKKSIIWSISARNDLQFIYDYYSRFSITIANKIIDKVMESVSSLEISANKNIGQYDDFNSDFRRIISRNYKIFYETFGEEILIIRVFDSRQDPEKSKSDE